MNYVACIAEGAAETAIIDILVDHHLLIFEREQMLDEQVLRCRNASTFESRYLRKGWIQRENHSLPYSRFQAGKIPS